MASKGQKFRKYPKDFKEKIKELYLSGIGTKNSISREYGVPLNTVSTWINIWNNPEKYGPKYLKKGKPRLDSDWKEKYEILKKYQAFLKAQRERK